MHPEPRPSAINTFVHKCGDTLTEDPDDLTRLVGLLPDGLGQDGSRWNSSTAVTASGGTVIARFPADTFSLLPPEYWEGMASCTPRGPPPGPGNREPRNTTPHEIILCLWETKATREQRPITSDFTTKMEYWSRTRCIRPEAGFKVETVQDAC